MLCSMTDRDAGMALKAALTYQAGGEVSALPAAAQCAYEAMRDMINLSRIRSQVGKAGGDYKRLEQFAASKIEFAASKLPETQPAVPLEPDDFDILAGLAEFM